MTATPFLYWVTGVLSFGDYETDLDIWHAFSLLSLALSVFVMCRLFGYSTATSLAFMIPLLVWFTPNHIDLREGNVNSVQLGVVALLLWLQSRSASMRYLFASGMVIGLLVMFKPNLARVALLLAGGYAVRQQYSKMWIAASGIVTGASTAVLVSSWWIGSATIWLDWVKVLGGTMRFFSRQGDSYTVLTKVADGVSPPNQIILAISLCLLCLALLWWGRRRNPVLAGSNAEKNRETLENGLLVTMGCIVMLLASALVWLHYYLLMIPMLIFALRPWSESDQPKFLLVIMLRVLPVIALIIMLDTALIQLLGVEDMTYRTITSTASVLTLFLIGLWQFGRGINGRDDPGKDEVPGAH